MIFLKSLVVVCLIGCCVAAPKPVDWDNVGRKIKEFGDQVRNKVHEVKEKVLPAARSACDFVNKIPQQPFASFNTFPSQGYFPSSGRNFYSTPHFPTYYHHNSYQPHNFPHRPWGGRPDTNWGTRPGTSWGFRPGTSWGVHPGVNPSTSTTERVFTNNGFNPVSPGVSVSTTSGSTNPSNSNNNGFNSGGNPPTNVFNSGSNTIGPEVSVQTTSDSSNLFPFNNGFDTGSNPVGPEVAVQTTSDSSNIFPSNNGFDTGFNPVIPETILPVTVSTNSESDINSVFSNFHPLDSGSNTVHSLDPSFVGGFNVLNSASSTTTPATAFEQADLMGNDIPPFIPPSDDNGLDNSDEEVSNNSGNLLPEIAFGNRYNYN